MKDKTLKFKVTSEEKRKIEQDAENYGSTTSDYIRHKMLEKDGTPTDGKRTQKIVECLCEFSCCIRRLQTATGAAANGRCAVPAARV